MAQCAPGERLKALYALPRCFALDASFESPILNVRGFAAPRLRNCVASRAALAVSVGNGPSCLNAPLIPKISCLFDFPASPCPGEVWSLVGENRKFGHSIEFLSRLSRASPSSFLSLIASMAEASVLFKFFLLNSFSASFLCLSLKKLKKTGGFRFFSPCFVCFCLARISASGNCAAFVFAVNILLFTLSIFWS